MIHHGRPLDRAHDLGWNFRWLNLDGLRHSTANEPLKRKLLLIVNTVVDVERFQLDLVLSCGLEYLEPVFQSYVDGFDTRFHEIPERPAVFYLCDFLFLFDRGPMPYRPIT